jgi:hypothetical protein
MAIDKLAPIKLKQGNAPKCVIESPESWVGIPKIQQP